MSATTTYVKSLFDPAAANEIIKRINQLNENSQRQWGTMNVSQMLAHCSASMETATGKKTPPRMFIGRIMGRFLKHHFSDNKPLQKSTPTDPSFVIKDTPDLRKEKDRLIKLIREFSEGGEAKCTTHPHSFFGKLTTKEWSTGMYKHLDHHLRQFGA